MQQGVYIGESARTCEDRLKEHPRAPSPIYYYVNTSGHHSKLENFPLCAGSHIPCSRKLYTSGSIIHPSIGTLGSTSYPTYGMRSCSALLTSNPKRPSLPGQLGPLHKAHNTSPQGITGAIPFVYNLNNW